MRFTEQLIKNQKNVDQKTAKRKTSQYDTFYEDEEYYAYEEAPKFGFLNEDKGVFDNTDKTSLNTAPSVFEKGTVFHVKNQY